MYCIKCGVRLADTEKKCPLCQTVVYHPELKPGEADPLYPPKPVRKIQYSPRAINGVLLILFFIPMAITFFADLNTNGRLDWFGYAAGAIVLSYLLLALPLWFRKPNPVIFVPCGFVAATLYLLYVCLASGGSWFLSFAFPLSGGMCLIVTATITLLRYIRGGRLYIWGGTIIALGLYTLLVELMLQVSFGIPFKGWCFIPISVTTLLGCTLFFLAINRAFREMMERKLFF